MAMASVERPAMALEVNASEIHLREAVYIVRSQCCNLCGGHAATCAGVSAST